MCGREIYHCPDHGRKGGFVLLLVLILMVSLSAIAGALIISLTSDYRNLSIQSNDEKAISLAEAGLAKAMFNLKTPGMGGPCFSGANPSGENWVTAGCTENLGGGTYTMVVQRWDYALSSNGSTASASSTGGGNVPSRAIDNNTATFWQSGGDPSPARPQWIIVTFPFPLTINKVRFLAVSAIHRPRDYDWQVSTDPQFPPNPASFVMVFRDTNAPYNSAGTANVFSHQSNVKHLRLYVRRSGNPNLSVRVRTLEAIGSRVTSTGTVNAQSRTVVRSLVADDAAPEIRQAFPQSDWAEI